MFRRQRRSRLQTAGFVIIGAAILMTLYRMTVIPGSGDGVRGASELENILGITPMQHLSKSTVVVDPKCVLLVGGAGYVGSHVALHLVAHGYKPVVLDSLVRGHAEFAKFGPLYIGDIADQALVRRILFRHRPFAIMHFAAFAYVGESVVHPQLYWHNNVQATLALVEAVVGAGFNNFVFSSTCATFGVPETNPITEEFPQHPISAYGRSKLAVEFILRDYAVAFGLKSAILRYFNAAGADPDGTMGEYHEPETHIIPACLDAAIGRRPAVEIYGAAHPTRDGTCVRDFIHVLDLASAHRLSAESLFRAGPGVSAAEASLELNLGSGNGTSVREVLAATARVTKRPVPQTVVPARAGDPPMLVGSSAKARRVLGWEPKYPSIDAIVSHAWQWHQTLHGPGLARLYPTMRRPSDSVSNFTALYGSPDAAH